MKVFSNKKLSLHYRISGKGNPVVFLHGFLEDHSIWIPLAKSLEEMGMQTILIDLPCHGQSRFSGEICSMQDMAALVADFLKSENVKSPHLIGHSMGGYVGLEVLKRHSAKLTLLHSNFWEDPLEKKKDRNRVVEIVKQNKLRLIQEAIPNLFALENRKINQPSIDMLIERASMIPTEEICASTIGMRDRENNHALFESHEISLIHGVLDNIVTTEKLMEELEKLTAQPAVYEIQNCGHMSIWEKPNELFHVIKMIVFK